MNGRYERKDWPDKAGLREPLAGSGREHLLPLGNVFALAGLLGAVGATHFGAGGAVMPGQGRAVERAYRPEEREALGDRVAALGETTFDVHLNGEAFWRNVPAAVWEYRLGGYQVLKKWLSYRERRVLDRRLGTGEVQHFADTARRIGALLLWGGSKRGMRVGGQPSRQGRAPDLWI